MYLPKHIGTSAEIIFSAGSRNNSAQQSQQRRNYPQESPSFPFAEFSKNPTSFPRSPRSTAPSKILAAEEVCGLEKTSLKLPACADAITFTPQRRAFSRASPSSDISSQMITSGDSVLTANSIPSDFSQPQSTSKPPCKVTKDSRFSGKRFSDN